MESSVAKEIEGSIRVKELLKAQVPAITSAAKLMISSIQGGGKILFCGNGGSAADSQHIAAEFVGRFTLNRPALPAIALTTNTSILTAIANDFSYEETFSRQVQALADKRDVLVGISTSGRSRNVLAAIDTAKAKGCRTIGLTGSLGAELEGAVDVCVKVPSDNTQRIQECHILVGHILCGLVEDSMQG